MDKVDIILNADNIRVVEDILKNNNVLDIADQGAFFTYDQCKVEKDDGVINILFYLEIECSEGCMVSEKAKSLLQTGGISIITEIGQTARIFNNHNEELCIELINKGGELCQTE